LPSGRQTPEKHCHRLAFSLFFRVSILPLQQIGSTYTMKASIIVFGLHYLGNRIVEPIKIKYMEVITMEKKAFDLMMARYEALVKKVELLKYKANGKRLEKWLTGHEVCQQLRISQRTLQKLRDRRFLGHTQIGRQFYYSPDEVKAIVPLIARIKSV